MERRRCELAIRAVHNGEPDSAGYGIPASRPQATDQALTKAADDDATVVYCLMSRHTMRRMATVDSGTGIFEQDHPSMNAFGFT